MKPKRRRTKITLETRRLIVITGHNHKRVWCAGCEQEALMISVDEASSKTGKSALSIYRGLDAGQIHYSETDEGALLVCLESICRSI